MINIYIYILNYSIIYIYTYKYIYILNYGSNIILDDVFSFVYIILLISQQVSKDQNIYIYIYLDGFLT